MSQRSYGLRTKVSSQQCLASRRLGPRLITCCSKFSALSVTNRSQQQPHYSEDNASSSRRTGSGGDGKGGAPSLTALPPAGTATVLADTVLDTVLDTVVLVTVERVEQLWWLVRWSCRH